MKTRIVPLAIITVLLVIFTTTGCTKKSVNATEDNTTTTTNVTIQQQTEESRIFQEETIATTAQVTQKKTNTKSNTTPTQKKTTTVAVTTTDKRQTTGEDKKLTFNKGENVLGAWIEINGKGFSGLIKNAPMGGTITSGVINPWEKEMIGMKIISNDEIFATTTTSTNAPQTTNTPPSTTSQTRNRVATGVSQSKNFQIGDTVVGWSVSINGKTIEGQVVLYNSPVAGIVTDGVINPWSSEINNQRVITIANFS